MLDYGMCVLVVGVALPNALGVDVTGCVTFVARATVVWFRPSPGQQFRARVTSPSTCVILMPAGPFVPPAVPLRPCDATGEVWVQVVTPEHPEPYAKCPPVCALLMTKSPESPPPIIGVVRRGS